MEQKYTAGIVGGIVGGIFFGIMLGFLLGLVYFTFAAGQTMIPRI